MVRTKAKEKMCDSQSIFMGDPQGASPEPARLRRPDLHSLAEPARPRIPAFREMAGAHGNGGLGGSRRLNRAPRLTGLSLNGVGGGPPSERLRGWADAPAERPRLAQRPQFAQRQAQRLAQRPAQLSAQRDLRPRGAVRGGGYAAFSREAPSDDDPLGVDEPLPQRRQRATLPQRQRIGLGLPSPFDGRLRGWGAGDAGGVRERQASQAESSEEAPAPRARRPVLLAKGAGRGPGSRILGVRRVIQKPGAAVWASAAQARRAKPSLVPRAVGRLGLGGGLVRAAGAGSLRAPAEPRTVMSNKEARVDDESYSYSGLYGRAVTGNRGAAGKKGAAIAGGLGGKSTKIRFLKGPGSAAKANRRPRGIRCGAGKRVSVGGS